MYSGNEIKVQRASCPKHEWLTAEFNGFIWRKTWCTCPVPSGVQEIQVMLQRWHGLTPSLSSVVRSSYHVCSFYIISRISYDLLLSFEVLGLKRYGINSMLRLKWVTLICFYMKKEQKSISGTNNKISIQESLQP